MSCNPKAINNCSPCCLPKPVCDPTNEALASQLNNLIAFLFGVLTKSCNAQNEVVWTLPCDLQAASPIPGYPNTSGSMLCYLISVLTEFSTQLNQTGIIDLAVTNTDQVVIDWSLGDYFRYDGTSAPGTVNFIHQNQPAEPTAKTITVLLYNGSYSIGWSTGKWSSGTPISTKSSGDDIITFSSLGSNGVYGSAVTDMS